jgi:hypothetical protein
MRNSRESEVCHCSWGHSLHSPALHGSNLAPDHFYAAEFFLNEVVYVWWRVGRTTIRTTYQVREVYDSAQQQCCDKLQVNPSQHLGI